MVYQYYFSLLTFQFTKAIIPLGLLLVIIIIVHNEWNYQTKILSIRIPMPIILEEKPATAKHFLASNISIQRYGHKNVSFAQKESKNRKANTNEQGVPRKTVQNDSKMRRRLTQVHNSNNGPLKLAKEKDRYQCKERVTKLVYIKTRKTGSSTMTNILNR